MRIFALVAAVFFVGVSAGPVCPDGILKGKMVGFAGNAESYLKLSDANIPELTRLSACWWVQSPETGEDTQEITYWTYETEDKLTNVYANDVKHLEFWINNMRAFGGPDFDVRFGLWHHLCLAWDNAEGEHQLYKDGRMLKAGKRFKKGEVIGGGGVIMVGQFLRKGRFSDGNAFKGNMASLNFWDSVIEPTAVQDIYNSGSSSFAAGNLVSWTCFKEGDLVGVETCDSILTGETHDTCEGGEFAGKVLQMDEEAGPFGYIEASQPIPDLKAFTACGWGKTTEKGTRVDIMNYRVKADSAGSIVLKNPSNVKLIVNTKNAADSGAAFNDGMWHHYCATWSSEGGAYQYIAGGKVVASGDGVAAGETIMGGGVLLLGVGQRRIGANYDFKNKFNNQIADFNLFSSVKSVEDIAMMMASCSTCCGDVISWHALTSRNISPDVVVKDSDVPYEEHM